MQTDNGISAGLVRRSAAHARPCTVASLPSLRLIQSGLNHEVFAEIFGREDANEFAVLHNWYRSAIILPQPTPDAFHHFRRVRGAEIPLHHGAHGRQLAVPGQAR